MTQSIREVARHVLVGTSIPVGKVSVLSALDDIGPLIRVWIDHDYLYRAKDIPPLLEGYRVVVSERPTFIASTSMP